MISAVVHSGNSGYSKFSLIFILNLTFIYCLRKFSNSAKTFCFTSIYCVVSSSESVNFVKTATPCFDKTTGSLIAIFCLANSISWVKDILKNKGDFKENFEKIKNQNIQGQEMIRSLLTRNGYPADYLEPKYICDKCRDKGFFDGQRCSCFEKLLTRLAVEKLNSEANMPDCDFEHFSLSYYKGKTTDSGIDCFKRMSDNLNFCKEYTKTFSLNSQDRKSVV